MKSIYLLHLSRVILEVFDSVRMRYTRCNLAQVHSSEYSLIYHYDEIEM
jgi:hypothetical protein